MSRRNRFDGRGGRRKPARPPEAAAATTLVSDTFTDANGTPINTHTPEVGGPWTNIAGVEIQTNRASVATGGSATIGIGQAATFTAQITAVNGLAGTAFLFKRAAAFDFAAIVHSPANLGSPNWHFLEYVAAAPTQLTDLGVAAAAGDVLKATVGANGRATTVYVNGVSLATPTLDASLAATATLALWEAGDGNTVTFDTLTITTP